MKSNTTWRRLSLIAVTLTLLAAIAPEGRAVEMAWTTVGNPGNAFDPLARYGNVDYAYKIGTYEVTNNQYVEFLNGKDPDGLNALDLYDAGMGTGPLGGIEFHPGNAPGGKYNVVAGKGNRPVNFISWYDALRFANWLNNGQGAGDTESGAYTLLGGTATPSNGQAIARNPGALVFVPSENEWFKAAYYNAATSTYFKYPTGTNFVPFPQAPPGVANSANYLSAVGNFTDVGAYASSPSAYGTFDQGGNVWEWDDSLLPSFPTLRAIRGASFMDPSTDLDYFGGGGAGPSDNSSIIGFRVAMAPEPSTFMLAVVSLLVLVSRGFVIRASSFF